MGKEPCYIGSRFRGDGSSDPQEPLLFPIGEVCDEGVQEDLSPVLDA